MSKVLAIAVKRTSTVVSKAKSLRDQKEQEADASTLEQQVYRDHIPGWQQIVVTERWRLKLMECKAAN